MRFKIYEKGNIINIINVNGNQKRVIGNELSKLYIFRMGLRTKFIFTKDKNSYKLFSYPDNKIILQNVICDTINYENYTVNERLNNGNKFKIFENSNGIFLEKSDKIITLDNNTKINIPNFKRNKHKKQLKILFNKVMINITKQGHTPNFLVYHNFWYRNVAIMGMVL